jgi:RNA polymerase sigma-70 factor (ECF subfamily)
MGRAHTPGTTQRLRPEQIQRALRALSAEQAEALALRVFAGLSAAEAAQVMGTSELAVKLLVHGAVRGLRERLLPGVESRQ